VTAGPVFRWVRLAAGTTRSSLCEGRHLRVASVLRPALVSAATATFTAGVWRLRPATAVRAAAAVRRSQRTLLVVAVRDAAGVGGGFVGCCPALWSVGGVMATRTTVAGLDVC
jgi:hypothetical protein